MCQSELKIRAARGILYPLFVFASIFVLSSCAGGIEDSDAIAPFGKGRTKVIAADPYYDFNAESSAIVTDAPLDKEIRIVLDNKIDAYSTLVESNFKLLTGWGSEVPGFLSMRFVPNPLDPAKQVSMVKFNPLEPLSPNTEYIFTWRGPGSSEEYPDGIPAELIGAVGADDRPVQNGFFRFRSGDADKFSDFENEQLEVVSFEPGVRIDNRNDLSIESAIRNAVTPNGNQPIRITFSEPIFNNFDAFDNPDKEIPETPIADFPGLTIATIKDVQSLVGDLEGDIESWSLDEWVNRRDDLYDTLRGRVWTEDGRKTLVFALDSKCSDGQNCRYPKTRAQAVVVIVRGLLTASTLRAQSNDPFIGAFFHVAENEILDRGFPDISNWLIENLTLPGSVEEND